MYDTSPTPPLVSAQQAQDSRKKSFLLVGIGVVILMTIALVASFVIGKSKADEQAANYEKRVSAYVASLSSKNGKTVVGDLKNYPTLNKASFGFLSTTYQQAAAKQAALSEDFTFLKNLSDGYTYLKDDVRRSLYYDQSAFFFDRYSAGTDTFVKTIGTDLPDKEYAKIVAKQYTGEAKAAKDYLKKLEKPVTQPLHTADIKKLVSVLHEFVNTAESCANDARQKPSEAKDKADSCNKSLTRHYYDSLVYYDFVAFFPYSMSGITPVDTVLAATKKHQAASFTNTSVAEAKLQAIIETKVALIKSLLPTSTKDKQFGVKADVVRSLNHQISDAIKNSDADTKLKKAYQQKLEPVIASLSLYDNPTGAKNGADDAGGFVGNLIDIISSDEPRRGSDEATQHYVHFKKRLEALKALEAPVYVKDELRKVIAIYESSLGRFKESDELSQKSVELTKKSEQKSGNLDAISDAFDAYKYFGESNEKYYEGRDILDNAKPIISAIGEKIDDTKTMTKQVIRQYDDLLSVK